MSTKKLLWGKECYIRQEGLFRPCGVGEVLGRKRPDGQGKTVRFSEKFLARAPRTDILFACLPVREGKSPPSSRVEVMTGNVGAELDFIEELRLRRWARENHVSREHRETSWHPVIHEEMSRKDRDMAEAEPVPAYA